jgi:hypothetical protein
MSSGSRFRLLGTDQWVTNPQELLESIVQILRSKLKTYHCGGCRYCCYGNEDYKWMCDTKFGDTNDCDIDTYIRFYQAYDLFLVVEKQSYEFVDNFPEITTNDAWIFGASDIKDLFAGVLNLKE